ncbi:hypothetical protein PV386_17150, partial [Streptomyces europaeiscabiei]
MSKLAGAGRGRRVDLGQCCLAALDRGEDAVVVAQRVRRAHPYAPGHLAERVDRGRLFAQADGVAVLVQLQGGVGRRLGEEALRPAEQGSVREGR